MNGLLLDTHIWLWYLGGSSRLPIRVAERLTADHLQAWLSPISVWELGILIHRGRLTLDAPIRSWTDDALARFPLLEATVNREVALVSSEIDLPTGDPADHLLAATALVYGLTLVTLDQHLAAAELVPTWPA
ncbi:MAG: type II toxin-antitoxin system VapC family toxin [Acidimicrobiia bacterium]|nr:type II toxin-antitoxin system VapC family toxin [Acidimicrobiia bacterium]